jgi:1A family penicillin-binding protein
MSLDRRRKSRYSRRKYNTRSFSSSRKSGSFLSSLAPQNIKGTVKDLFTTKEGWKKIGIGALIFMGFIFALFIWYAKDLPTPNKINSKIMAQSTQIFDRNGKLLYEIHGDQNRILADWNEIPQNCKNAAIAIEDKDFYKHGGFSVSGIARAFTGLVYQDRTKGGGSTITQQFVRNALLTTERSYSRKIKEIILSIEIEQMYKKDDILRMYLNEIPYGSNAYGIKVAAKTYFNKDLKNLNLQECAVLAAMPQAPTYYSPYGTHKDALMARKNTVLTKMAEQKYITKEEAAGAEEKVIAFSNNPYGSITAPHFVMYVREKLVEKYGEKMTNEGGLKVYTSLDLSKQKSAEEAVATNVDKNKARYKASNASLVSMDPKTGQILAMVGSRDFFNEDIDGNVNVSLMDRQPGSSFKPFAYATAWKTSDWGPGSILFDLRTDFGGGYVPNNYDGKFRGPVTMRRALQNSLNIPAVKTLYLAGMDETLSTAKAMGITTLNNRDAYGLSLVLGAGEVKLIDMTSAYGVFANNGVRMDPTWFVRIEDNKGKVLDEYKNRSGKRVLDAQVAYLMNNVLSDDASRAEIFGRGGPLTLSGRPVAAKTGTTNSYKDAWTMGYTPSLVTGVWAGNNDNTAMSQAGGSIAAAPIWHDYMTKALANSPVEQFQRPSGIKTVTLDSVNGKQPSGGKTVTDIFASWFQIKSIPGVTKSYKINKLTGKLVNDSCPPDSVNIETRYTNPITAEIPSSDSAFSRWFAPIQAWAAQNGYVASSAPTETDNCSDINNQGRVKVELIDQQNPSGRTVELTFSVNSSKSIQSFSATLGSQSGSVSDNGDGTYTAVFHNVPINVNQPVTATAIDSDGKQGTYTGNYTL